MPQSIFFGLKSFRISSVQLLLAVCFLAGPITASHAAVVGVFDASRAGFANFENGIFATQARASLYANFPGTTISSTPTLTAAFLSGVDMVLLTSAAGDADGSIDPLSPAEQTALYNFVLNGGTAVLLADTYDAELAAQTIVAPFGVSVVDDNLSGLQMGTIQQPSHPIFDGPFGVQSQVAVLGAGVFNDLGPYATSLATMDSTGLPILATIEAGAIAPGSGRVLLISDATPFADPIADGYFSESEILFLNSIQYLVPEPATNVIAAIGLALLAMARGTGFGRRRQR